jgi:hypothetical protein
VADGGCLRVLARAGEIDEGVITLGEAAAGAAGSDDVVVLEHAATVLAPELAHRRNIAESELPLRRDLVEDLLAGTDTDSAQDRARAPSRPRAAPPDRRRQRRDAGEGPRRRVPRGAACGP